MLATSPSIRRILAANPRLPEILRSIDTLRGGDREEALKQALGVGEHRHTAVGLMAEDDQATLRQLAEAIEAAVRGGKENILGLNWDD